MCGITGIISKDDEVFDVLVESLFHLQHRGQSSYGFATSHHGNIDTIRERGHVSRKFRMHGKIGIGQVRYPTSGQKDTDLIQPFVSKDGRMALCHNGNIANYEALPGPKPDIDSQYILQQFETLKGEITDIAIIETVIKLSLTCRASYSVILMISGYGLVVFKDLYGIKPLIYGKRGSCYVVSSESISIDAIGYDVVRDVKNGEIVIFRDGTHYSHNYLKSDCVPRPCIFEWVYIARAESVINGASVYKTRLNMGEYLAEKIKRSDIDLGQIDYVVPVPDTSKPVALKVSECLGLTYREGIIKNPYIGRTFIMDTQKQRVKNIKRKLGIVKPIIEGKTLLVIDDSVVRGNTLKQIINLLKHNGAVKVYFASCSPPIRYPNLYGIDIPTKDELIANNKTVEMIEKEYGIERFIYQDLEDLKSSITKENGELTTFDTSIFDGDYPTS